MKFINECVNCSVKNLPTQGKSVSNNNNYNRITIMNNSAEHFSVLIVDDVPTNVMLVQAILKKEGYTLLTCDRGAKA